MNSLGSLERVLVFHIATVLLRVLRKCFEKSFRARHGLAPAVRVRTRDPERGGVCLSRQSALSLLRGNFTCVSHVSRRNAEPAATFHDNTAARVVPGLAR